VTGLVKTEKTAKSLAESISARAFIIPDTGTQWTNIGLRGRYDSYSNIQRRAMTLRAFLSPGNMKSLVRGETNAEYEREQIFSKV